MTPSHFTGCGWLCFLRGIVTGSSPTSLRPAAAWPRPFQFGPPPALSLRARGPPPCSGAGPGQPLALAPAPSSGRSRRRRHHRRVHSWSPSTPPLRPAGTSVLASASAAAEPHGTRSPRKSEAASLSQRDQEVIVTKASSQPVTNQRETGWGGCQKPSPQFPSKGRPASPDPSLEEQGNHS